MVLQASLNKFETVDDDNTYFVKFGTGVVLE